MTGAGGGGLGGEGGVQEDVAWKREPRLYDPLLATRHCRWSHGVKTW